jgi:hypothetical protein
MTYLQVRAVRRMPSGDHAPFLAGLARRHLAVLEEIGPQPRPAEPVSTTYQRRHRRELDQLQTLARVLSLTVLGVSDA